MRLGTLGRFSAAIAVLLMAASAFAQSSGSFRGTVTDSSGGVLPGVTVTMTNEATKFARTAVADAKGSFYFAAVEPGTYTIKSELSGFKVREVKGIRVGTNESAGTTIAMEVGAQSETITVSAEREMIQTQTGAREGLITPEQIENISIIGRNPIELLRTLPAWLPPTRPHSRPWAPSRASEPPTSPSASTAPAPRTSASPSTVPTCATSATTAAP
jgi:hypothetical protein